jgi:ABC-type antimicrobial peptide transport system permease subunit
LSLVALGTVIGGFAALAISRWLSSSLYSVTAADPITYLGVALLLASAAALASVIPAQRATSVDPIHALRYE